MEALDREVKQSLPSPNKVPTSSVNQATMTTEHSTRVADNLTLSSPRNTEPRRGSGVSGGDRRSPVAWASFYQPR